MGSVVTYTLRNSLAEVVYVEYVSLPVTISELLLLSSTYYAVSQSVMDPVATIDSDTYTLNMRDLKPVSVKDMSTTWLSSYEGLLVFLV